jgi:hypothetical protein
VGGRRLTGKGAFHAASSVALPAGSGTEHLAALRHLVDQVTHRVLMGGTQGPATDVCSGAIAHGCRPAHPRSHPNDRVVLGLARRMHDHACNRARLAGTRRPRLNSSAEGNECR